MIAFLINNCCSDFFVGKKVKMMDFMALKNRLNPGQFMVAEDD
jgi:hypothetical protein